MWDLRSTDPCCFHSHHIDWDSIQILSPGHAGFFLLCEPINSSLASWLWVLAPQWETAEDRALSSGGNTSQMIRVYHRASGKAKSKMLTLSLSNWGYQQQGCLWQCSKEHSRTSVLDVLLGSKLGSIVHSRISTSHQGFASPCPASLAWNRKIMLTRGTS